MKICTWDFARIAGNTLLTISSIFRIITLPLTLSWFGAAYESVPYLVLASYGSSAFFPPKIPRLYRKWKRENGRLRYKTVVREIQRWALCVLMLQFVVAWFFFECLSRVCPWYLLVIILVLGLRKILVTLKIRVCEWWEGDDGIDINDVTV